MIGSNNLNPVAAGIVALPGESPRPSIEERVEHVMATGRIADVCEIRNASVAATAVTDGLEREVYNIFTRLGSSAERWGRGCLS